MVVVGNDENVKNKTGAYCAANESIETCSMTGEYREYADSGQIPSLACASEL